MSRFSLRPEPSLRAMTGHACLSFAFAARRRTKNSIGQRPRDVAYRRSRRAGEAGFTKIVASGTEPDLQGQNDALPPFGWRLFSIKENSAKGSA